MTRLRHWLMMKLIGKHAVIANVRFEDEVGVIAARHDGTSINIHGNSFAGNIEIVWPNGDTESRPPEEWRESRRLQ